MRRINITKILKTVAIGLIIMPEPFTTPVGVLLLGVVLAVYHKTSLDKFGDLDSLIKRSFLRKAEPTGFRRLLNTQNTVVHHRVKQTNAAPQCNFWFDNKKISAKVLHHTLKTSFPQYEASQLKRKPIEPVVAFHKLKTCL